MPHHPQLFRRSRCAMRPTIPRPFQVNAEDSAMPLRLIQLSDLHLFGDPSATLLGITTRQSFEAVLSLALAQPDPPQALILSGDLVQDASAAGYRYLRERLKRTEIPHYCIAGNHDLPALLTEHLGAAGLGAVALRRLAGWNLIFLDSSAAEQVSGVLTPTQLEQLAALLAAETAPALICLHHHPLSIGSAWMDQIGVSNGAALLALCERHPQVKAVLFGHVHQAFAEQRGRCWFLGAPATCFQFKPRSVNFALDDQPPGYRELTLYPNGQVRTRIVRLSAYAEIPLPQAGGY